MCLLSVHRGSCNLFIGVYNVCFSFFLGVLDFLLSFLFVRSYTDVLFIDCFRLIYLGCSSCSSVCFLFILVVLFVLLFMFGSWHLLCLSLFFSAALGVA